MTLNPPHRTKLHAKIYNKLTFTELVNFSNKNGYQFDNLGAK